jgi:hypothetical protein
MDPNEHMKYRKDEMGHDERIAAARQGNKFRHNGWGTCTVPCPATALAESCGAPGSFAVYSLEEFTWPHLADDRLTTGQGTFCPVAVETFEWMEAVGNVACNSDNERFSFALAIRPGPNSRYYFPLRYSPRVLYDACRHSCEIKERECWEEKRTNCRERASICERSSLVALNTGASIWYEQCPLFGESEEQLRANVSAITSPLGWSEGHSIAVYNEFGSAFKVVTESIQLHDDMWWPFLVLSYKAGPTARSYAGVGSALGRLTGQAARRAAFPTKGFGRDMREDITLTRSFFAWTESEAYAFYDGLIEGLMGQRHSTSSDWIRSLLKGTYDPKNQKAAKTPKRLPSFAVNYEKVWLPEALRAFLANDFAVSSVQQDIESIQSGGELYEDSWERVKQFAGAGFKMARLFRLRDPRASYAVYRFSSVPAGLD